MRIARCRWLLPVVCAFAAAAPNSIAPQNDAACDVNIQDLQKELTALKEENRVLKAHQRAHGVTMDNDAEGWAGVIKDSDDSPSPSPEPEEPKICMIDRLTLSLWNVTTISLINITKCEP